MGLQGADKIRVACPAFVFIQQDQEERCGVAGAVVGLLRTLAEVRHLAKPQLM